MLFWIVCALMTMTAVLAAIFPYWYANGSSQDATDIEVYKDQLTEIDVDEKRGLISASDAQNARVEVSRRILQADNTSKSNTNGPSRRFGGRVSQIIMMCASLSIPIISWGLYAQLGAPESPDQPIASRQNITATDPTMDELVAKAEAHLAVNPKDGRGWEVLAPIYLRGGRYQDAINAFETAARLNGSSVANEIGIGQALTALNNGRADDKARAAYERASKLDPNDPEPKLLLGIDLADQGKFLEAKAAFEAILATIPENAPLRVMLVDMIARVETASQLTPSQNTLGPTQGEIDQAAEMSPADRTSMIEGMVAQLDAKLAENPTDKEGWKRLIRSYAVLNKPEKLSEALKRAKQGLILDPKAMSEIDRLLLELSIQKP